jgi:uncharacterized membrane protein
MDFLLDFVQEFFVKPIETYSGYNPVNTLVYAVILLAIAFGLVYPLFRRQGVKFDYRFSLALLPYILFGISFRLLEDLKILPRSANPFEFWYYTISPGIWVLVGLTTIVALLLAIVLAKKFKLDRVKVFGVIGALLALPFFVYALTFFQEAIGFFAVLIGTALVVLLLSKLVPKLFGGWQNKQNRLALAAQTLDGMATFIAIQFFHCGEQHFLPQAIISLSPALFPLVKLILVIVILHYLDKEIENETLKGFIKTIIIILGFSTGLRDLFTLAAGTCGPLALGQLF